MLTRETMESREVMSHRCGIRFPCFCVSGYSRLNILLHSHRSKGTYVVFFCCFLEDVKLFGHDIDNGTVILEGLGNHESYACRNLSQSNSRDMILFWVSESPEPPPVTTATSPRTSNKLDVEEVSVVDCILRRTLSKLITRGWRV